MAADGRIIFKTKIDNSQVAKDLKDTEKKIKQFEQDISKAESAKLPLTKQMNELTYALDTAKKKQHELQEEWERIQAAMQPGTGPQEFIDAYARKSKVESDLKAQSKEVDNLQIKWDGVYDRLTAYNLKIKKATAGLAANKAQAGKLQAQLSKGGNMAAAFERASKAIHHFGRRLAGIAGSALVFSVVYRGIHQVVQYMGKALKVNEEYRAQLAMLKGALLTAFQPLYEFVLPVAISVLKILTAVVNVLANVFSILSGKTAKQSADSAKALKAETDAVKGLGGAAKEATKELASFDEINKLGSPGGGTAAGGVGGVDEIRPNFDAFDTDEYKRKIDELTVYISGALLALGAILAFSGANIPLGIGLMVAGAIGLAAIAKENWNDMPDSVRMAITIVTGILGGAFLAVGAVLAFSGVAVAKGIVLMALGVASLAGTILLNWDTIREALQGPIGAVVAVVSGALLVIGAVLAFTGVNLPLGIALMAAGAVGLVTVVALNWDTIKNALQGPMGAVTAATSTLFLAIGLVLCFSGIGVPLGIALIAAGAVGLVTTTVANWDTIVGLLGKAWESVKKFWRDKIAPIFTLDWWKKTFKCIGDALERTVTNALDKISQNPVFKLLFRKSASGTVADRLRVYGVYNGPPGNSLNVPKLARGAVLPANKPFMAMVGDQRNGTNVEAPLATIQEALMAVMELYGGLTPPNVNINFSGELAQLARVLKPAIDAENRRIGASLAKG